MRTLTSTVIENVYSRCNVLKLTVNLSDSDSQNYISLELTEIKQVFDML